MDSLHAPADRCWIGRFPAECGGACSLSHRQAGEEHNADRTNGIPEILCTDSDLHGVVEVEAVAAAVFLEGLPLFAAAFRHVLKVCVGLENAVSALGE